MLSLSAQCERDLTVPFGLFHKRHNISINANFVFPYTCSFLLYLYQIMLVNVELDINRYKRITFQGCRFNWSFSFLMTQLKRSCSIGILVLCEPILSGTIVWAHFKVFFLCRHFFNPFMRIFKISVPTFFDISLTLKAKKYSLLNASTTCIDQWSI